MLPASSTMVVRPTHRTTEVRRPTGRPVDDLMDMFLQMGPLGPVDRSVMLFNGMCIVALANRATSERASITYLWVSPSVRGRGYASNALERLRTLACCFNVGLLVRPGLLGPKSAPPNMTHRELCLWYEKRGFVPENRSRNYIYLPPGAK